MIETLKHLASLDGISGAETAVSDAIIAEIDGFCDWEKDSLGNIIAFKKGENGSKVKLLIDAHIDEVGLIITGIDDGGFLKFKTVGSINTEALLSRRVRINGSIYGVIGAKPIHLLDRESAAKLPEVDGLYIDIGACDKTEAQSLVLPGDTAVILGEFITEGDKILSKALDDRIGCAVLIKLLKSESRYDFYASFTVQEEVGLRGAKTASFRVNPQAAIILEGTTAADIAGVPQDKQVCVLGDGAAVSFMDRATVYNRNYFNAALKSGIPCQVKRSVTGGNNSGAVHLNREGVPTISISVPCRYIHTAASVADKRDILSAFELAEYMKNLIAGGDIQG